MTIVLYHGVAPKRERGIYNYRGKFIEPATFEKQLRYFKRHYTILGLDEAIKRLREGTLPPYALSITFDDGYHNFYEHAFPLLKKYDLAGTFFLTTDFVLRKKALWVDRLEYAIGSSRGSHRERCDRDNKIRAELKKLESRVREERLACIEKEAGAAFTNFEGERSVYAPLSDSEIQEMRGAGMMFGAHTKSHPILSTLTKESAQSEIIDSALELEKAMGPISSAFAYPNGQRGDWNHETERICESKFACALTTLEGTNTGSTHPFRLRRFAMDGTDSETFAVIASGVRLFFKRLLNYGR